MFTSRNNETKNSPCQQHTAWVEARAHVCVSNNDWKRNSSCFHFDGRSGIQIALFTIYMWSINRCDASRNYYCTLVRHATPSFMSHSFPLHTLWTAEHRRGQQRARENAKKWAKKEGNSLCHFLSAYTRQNGQLSQIFDRFFFQTLPNDFSSFFWIFIFVFGNAFC